MKSWRQVISTSQCSDVIMTTMTSQITSITIVYSIVYSDADQRKHKSSASLVFVRGIHRSPVNSPQKGPVTRKMFPFDDVIMDIARPGPTICCPVAMSCTIDWHWSCAIDALSQSYGGFPWLTTSVNTPVWPTVSDSLEPENVFNLGRNQCIMGNTMMSSLWRKWLK